MFKKVIPSIRSAHTSFFLWSATPRRHRGGRESPYCNPKVNPNPNRSLKPQGLMYKMWCAWLVYESTSWKVFLELEGLVDQAEKLLVTSRIFTCNKLEYTLQLIQVTSDKWQGGAPKSID